MEADQKRWNERFGQKGFALGKEPNPFLKRHLRLLPRGKVLDIAAGEGKNAVFLARHGFDVDAVDISEVGLRKAREWAREMGVHIHTVLADLESYPIERERYDLICDFYFLNRRLIPRIKRGLKKGGKVMIETYLIDHRSLRVPGPKNPKYFLKHNELLTRFRDLRILFYREGTYREGGRRKAIASLIAEKVK